MNRKDRIEFVIDHIRVTRELIETCERMVAKELGDEDGWIRIIETEKLVLEDLRKELKDLYGLPH